MAEPRPAPAAHAPGHRPQPLPGGLCPPAAPGGQPLLPLPGPGDPGAGGGGPADPPHLGGAGPRCGGPPVAFPHRRDRLLPWLPRGARPPLAGGMRLGQPPGEPGKEIPPAPVCRVHRLSPGPVVPGQPFLRPVRAGETQPDDRERMLRCPGAATSSTPRSPPAVIVAVTHGDRILMTRYQGRALQGLRPHRRFHRGGGDRRGHRPPGGF